MSPKLFIEVDAGKEQPEEDAAYYVKFCSATQEWKGTAQFKNGMFIHGFGTTVTITHWLRPIQQQEGCSREQMENYVFGFFTWMMDYRLNPHKEENLWRHKHDLFVDGKPNLFAGYTLSELFNQFINSLKDK